MTFQLYSPKQWYCQLNSFLAQHNWSQLIIPNNCDIMRNVCNLSCVMFVQFFKIEQFPHENWQSDIIICCCLSFGYCCAWNVMDRNPKNKKAEHRKKNPVNLYTYCWPEPNQKWWTRKSKGTITPRTNKFIEKNMVQYFMGLATSHVQTKEKWIECRKAKWIDLCYYFPNTGCVFVLWQMTHEFEI